MNTLDTTKPSRELDAAVARALDYAVHVTTERSWEDDGTLIDAGDYCIAHSSGDTHLPFYSRGSMRLLEAVIWLARRGCSIHITQDLQSCEVSQYRYDDEFTFVRVPGTDDQAFALAVCRAVVLIAERSEP